MEAEIIENPSLLCRVCLDSGIYKLNILLEVENEKIILQDMLKEFSSMEEFGSSSDDVPSMLCSSCLSQLGQSYIFLKKVRKADEQIKLFFDHIIEEEAEDLIKSTINSDYENHAQENDKSTIASDVEELEFISPIIGEEYIKNGESLPSATTLKKTYYKEKPKQRKRPANFSKKPVIVLTENVAGLLSRARKPSLEGELEEEVLDEFTAASDEPPSKKSKPDENNSYIVTKFVLAEPTAIMTSYSTLEAAEDGASGESGGAGVATDSENNLTPTVNHIRTMDIAAVEIDATSKIRIEEIDDDTNIENPNTMYMCKYCPKAFSTSHHLIMHSRKSHVCQFCMQSFVKVDDLHRHSKEAHNSFKCTLCEKDFTNNSNLRQHIKRVHHIELPAYVSLLSVKRKDSVT